MKITNYDIKINIEKEYEKNILRMEYIENYSVVSTLTLDIDRSDKLELKAILTLHNGRTVINLMEIKPKSWFGLMNNDLLLCSISLMNNHQNGPCDEITYNFNYNYDFDKDKFIFNNL